MPDHLSLLQRKGAARIAQIPPEVLHALNTGQVATVNLVEFLAIDLGELARNVARDVGLDANHARLQDTLAMLDAFKPMQRHGHIARALYDMTAALALPSARDYTAHRLATHPSDMARSWAAYWLSCTQQSFAQKLGAVRRFAADSHFGVREMAWSALRNDLIADVDGSLALLTPWVQDADANIRRFACEITRPRGVWCAQAEILKDEPWRALPLLECLRADDSRYVQNSVANWLNDASKSQSAWVRALCLRWEAESPTAATRYITHRALRTLRKADLTAP